MKRALPSGLTAASMGLMVLTPAPALADPTPSTPRCRGSHGLGLDASTVPGMPANPQ